MAFCFEDDTELLEFPVRLEATRTPKPNNLSQLRCIPISATVIVAQLLLGAEGEFKEQLHQLLSLPGQQQVYNVQYYNKIKNETGVLFYAPFHLHLSSLLKKLQRRKVGERFTLNQSNALFYNQNITLNEYFKRHLKGFYDSEIAPLDFNEDTASIINNWSSSHTNGLIPNILSSSPAPSTSGIFLNSIYFLAEWETPFSNELNRNDTFHINENDTVTVTYMHGMLLDVPYIETNDYKLVCLPYKNNELGMYIILPKPGNPDKYNINKFSDDLNAGDVLSNMLKAEVNDVVMKIPKLSLSNTLRLLQPLQKYTQFKKEHVEQKADTNVIDIIEDNVDDFKNFTSPKLTDIFLTNAAEDEGLRVSDIVQQMVFSINEKGTEAAAVTAGIVDYMGGSKPVVLNRPFVFFILHKATRAVLFWGTIVDPSKN
ncbi:hypothetical protein NQ317_017463 [Molorchus minor]|uniref:Serpin domain-containing protein n=1 Tax=Molorchus minor TaxID=1323400 RepID=A0ABQ9IZF5_9CUCU|nr:hypothetical protein NQ317_017463 [Molorchus minor]